MKRQGKRAAAFVLAFVVVAVLLGGLARFVLFDNVHSYTRHMMGELYTTEQNDWLFLGSSHCYRSIDPMLVEELTGHTAFDGGSSQQLITGSYYLLREAAEQAKPQTVYLEMFYTMTTLEQTSEVPLATYILTDYMRPGVNKYSLLWELGGAGAFVDDLIPERHSTISPDEIVSTWKAKLTDGYQQGNYTYVTYPDEEYRGKGFAPSLIGLPEGYSFQSIGDVNAEQPISDYVRQWLDKINDYCVENDIQLVLFAAPLPSAYAAQVADYQAYEDAVRSWCSQHSREFWDFTLYRGLEDLTCGDFSDDHHLSASGAEKVTAAFCNVAMAEKPEQLFYDTLEEKLALQPDQTL